MQRTHPSTRPFEPRSRHGKQPTSLSAVCRASYVEFIPGCLPTILRPLKTSGRTPPAAAGFLDWNGRLPFEDFDFATLKAWADNRIAKAARPVETGWLDFVAPRPEEIAAPNWRRLPPFTGGCERECRELRHEFTVMFGPVARFGSRNGVCRRAGHHTREKPAMFAIFPDSKIHRFPRFRPIPRVGSS